MPGLDLLPRSNARRRVLSRAGHRLQVETAEGSPQGARRMSRSRGSRRGLHGRRDCRIEALISELNIWRNRCGTPLVENGRRDTTLSWLASLLGWS